ncbi:MAG: hypothetical protein Q9218_007487 [Villophora microphyllina]
MPFQSPYPQVDVPKCNVLNYVFPVNEELSDTSLWIDSSNVDHSLSPREILQWVKRLALGLHKLGVEKGHRVMTFTPNHIFVPVAYLGIIENTQTSILLVHPDNLSTALSAAQRAGLPTSRIFLFSDVACAETHGIHDWRSILSSCNEAAHYSFEPIAEDKAASTVATLNYSSGTTGLPKGVCVSHYNLCANVAQTSYLRYALKDPEIGNRPTERWIGFLPLYHAFGQLYICLLSIKLQIPVYILKTFDFSEVLRVIQTYKITHLHLAPPVMVLLAKRPETALYDLSSLSNIACGAAPLSRDLQNEVSEKLNVQIAQGWGMTELTCSGSGFPLGYVDNTGSIGMLLPNCEGKLLDDNGNEARADEPGELHIRGPNVCLGYWKNPAATTDTISLDGWLKTGDVAMAKDNRFWIVDRKKELIKVKGFQVAPAELEAVLLNNDNVDDAAVVGVTLHGEEFPRAYIALKEHAKAQTSADDIQKWMESQVAKHKRLSGGIAFVETVPKSPSGKILRKILREWAKRDRNELEIRVRARL